jgi:hypothetical protein
VRLHSRRDLDGRIRNADFRRMTIERLMTIVNRFGSRIEFRMRLRPIPTGIGGAR